MQDTTFPRYVDFNVSLPEFRYKLNINFTLPIFWKPTAAGQNVEVPIFWKWPYRNRAQEIAIWTMISEPRAASENLYSVRGGGDMLGDFSFSKISFSLPPFQIYRDTFSVIGDADFYSKTVQPIELSVVETWCRRVTRVTTLHRYRCACITMGILKVRESPRWHMMYGPLATSSGKS